MRGYLIKRQLENSRLRQDHWTYRLRRPKSIPAADPVEVEQLRLLRQSPSKEDPLLGWHDFVLRF